MINPKVSNLVLLLSYYGFNLLFPNFHSNVDLGILRLNITTNSEINIGIKLNVKSNTIWIIWNIFPLSVQYIKPNHSTQTMIELAINNFISLKMKKTSSKYGTLYHINTAKNNIITSIEEYVTSAIL